MTTPKVHYTVVKKFTDHGGVVHFPGEIATLFTGATYGVLEDDEIPLLFHRNKHFVGVKETYIEEELCPKASCDLTV